MSTRFFLFLIVALLSLNALSSGSLAATPRPPNVILFLIDDWGWTDGGTLGSKLYETPNLDRLAAEGMKFTQAYSACTVCSPTRAAIMTGKYPARLRITDWIAGHRRPFAKLKIPDWTLQLPLEEQTIAEVVKARGYATGLFGKWHLGNEPFYPEKQGFDVNVGGTNMGSPRNYFPPYGLKDEQPGEFLSDRLTRDAVTFITANREKPFFIYFPHYAVHTPIAGKPEVIEKYKKKLAAGTYTQTNPVYAALVESVDDSLGSVMRTLADLKLEENTIILITGDNGGLSGLVNAEGWRLGPTSNDPLRLGKGSAYEGGVRVPLIVKWPGVTAPGSTNATPVISMDLFSTVREITDTPGAATAAGRLSTNSPVDGESLVPLLKGAAKLPREAIYWHYPHYHPGSATPYSAIRADDWKLIHFFEDDHVELYNLKDDIGEKNDLSTTNVAKTTELRSKLVAWRKSVSAQLPEKNPNYDPAKAWEPDRSAAKAKKKQ